MLFDFKDMCPIKKAYYFGRTIKDLEDFTPWLGKERKDIPEKYQTYDGYWFFVEDPIKKFFE